MGDEKILGIRVQKAHGDGVVLKVYDQASGEVQAEHAATTWAELEIRRTQYGVPPERWKIDEDAEAILDE
jgi:hypothetical protein